MMKVAARMGRGGARKSESGKGVRTPLMCGWRRQNHEGLQNH